MPEQSYQKAAMSIFSLNKRLLHLGVYCVIILIKANYGFAIDFSIRGQWIISFGYGENGAFEGKYRGHEHTGWGSGQDTAETKEKIALSLGVVASDYLSGTLAVETGDIYLGQKESAGALGSDEKFVKVNNAFIDLVFPGTEIKTRMGIFGMTTPAMASGNSVYNGTAAGIMLSAPLTENLNTTLFWVRLYNDNYTGRIEGKNTHFHANFLDNIDAVGLLFPFVSDIASVTPWILYSANGPNAFRKGGESDGFAFGNIDTVGGANIYRAGMFPAGGSRHKNFAVAHPEISEYSNGWWLGLTGNIHLFTDWLITCDFEYGSVTWPNDGHLTRRGWYASILLEYMFDWGRPGIYAWHSSGDDGNPANGSERMPHLDGDDNISYSHFAFNGSPYIERNSLVGANLAGTWGIGARILDVEFVRNLSHTLRANLIGGSNSPTMAKKMSLAGLWANGHELSPCDLGAGAHLGMPNLYLTSLDRVLELSTTTTFKIFNDFLVCIEGAYAALWLDTGTNCWGARHRLNQGIPQTKDAWNTNLSLVYSF